MERLTCRAVTTHMGSGAFSGRHLGSIDLDLFPCLVYLDCAENQISRICSSRPAELRVLDARENGLMCIDESACASLESVRCSLGVGVDEIVFCVSMRTKVFSFLLSKERTWKYRMTCSVNFIRTR